MEKLVFIKSILPLIGTQVLWCARSCCTRMFSSY